MGNAETILQYNGFLLIFSAIGFLLSLMWVLLAEKSKRSSDDGHLTDKDLFDEQVFYDEFENIENPSKNLKPIFENISPVNDETTISNSNQTQKSFSKEKNLPSFPTLKKEIEDTLESKPSQDSGVNDLLGEIKKEIKNNTKGRRRKKK